jgi:hypothetical protein
MVALHCLEASLSFSEQKEVANANHPHYELDLTNTCSCIDVFDRQRARGFKSFGLCCMKYLLIHALGV